MSIVVIACLMPEKAWTLGVLPAMLILPPLLRPLWNPATDVFDIVFWWLALAFVGAALLYALGLLHKLRRNGGAVVWAEGRNLHTLTWRAPVRIADIVEVRISQSVGFVQAASVMLVLNDERVRDISGRALAPHVEEIAGRIRALTAAESTAALLS